MFDHLSVVDKADKFPLAQMDDPLGHVLSHVYDGDFFVPRCERLVREKGVVDDPRLGHGLLMVEKNLLVVLCIEHRAEHVQFDLIATVLFVNDRSEDSAA